MTLDTTMTSGNVPATNKRRAVMAGKFDISKFAKAKGGKSDPGEPDADDKKPAKGGKFKKAYTAKFGK